MTSEKKMVKMNPNYWYIDGVAYDFGPFVKKHPGGQYAIYLAKGQEGRSLLESYHWKMPSESLLRQYRLPEDKQIETPEWKAFPPSMKFTYEEDGFFRTVKREAKKYFDENKMSHKAPWSHVLMFVLNVVAMLYSLYYYVHNQSYVFAVIHGFLRAILVVQTTHAASHFSFSSWPMINRWAYRLGTVMIGLWCPKTWDYQHIVAHHIYTNEWPYDTDSAFPLKSILYNQRRLFFHKYQHLYMWFVYAFTIPLVMINSFRELANERQATFKMRFDVPFSRLEAWICSIGSVIYVVLPFFFLDFWTALPLVLVSNVFSSLFFSLQFVVNHEIDFIVPGKSFPENVDFGAYQLDQALSFSPDSRRALELSGGLNTQIEHHLFPCVHYSHYMEMSRITRKVAKDFGLEYNTRPHWYQAVLGHYNLLRNPPKSIKESSKKSKENGHSNGVSNGAATNGHAKSS